MSEPTDRELMAMARIIDNVFSSDEPYNVEYHLLDADLDAFRAVVIAARDAEWRAAVAEVSERIGTNSPYVDAALDALLAAMEVPHDGQ